MEATLFIVVLALPLDAALLLLWFGPLWSEQTRPGKYPAIWSAGSTLLGRANPRGAHSSRAGSAV
jgi:hypothetical protein